MQIILIKYVPLFCFAVFFSSSKSTCDVLLMGGEREERRMYQRSSCAIDCMKRNFNRTLEVCYKKCENYGNNENLTQIYENFDLQLICRDDTSLLLKIVAINYNESIINKSNSTIIEPKLFLFKVAENKTSVSEPMTLEIYLTESKVIEIKNLKPNKFYEISATVIYPNNGFSVVAKGLQFSTLERMYKPEEISNVVVRRYETRKDNKLLDAIVTWKPAKDKTCFYEILYFATETGITFEFMQTEIKPRKPQFDYRIKNLTFATEYQIGIRGKNSKEASKESDIFWYNIRTPTCLEWFNNNLTICPPPIPEDLNVIEQYINLNIFSINVTWKKPILDPEYYIINIFDLSDFEDSKTYSVNVSKYLNFVFIPNIALYGLQYKLYLTASSTGGNSTAMVIGAPQRQVEVIASHHHRLIIAIVAIVLSVAFILIVVVVKCHKKSQRNRCKERDRYFMKLQQKSSVDVSSNFELSNKALSLKLNKDQLSQLQSELEEKLLINDEMEVENTDVELFEVLGEGAFGVVKNGLLRLEDGSKMNVAVKMLKMHPTIEDIAAFRREIEVMKDVGKHPNIVSIVGHCTKNVKEMLLLTEYCSLGNLLNFLRSEWKYLNRIIQHRVNEPNCTILFKKQNHKIFNEDAANITVENTTKQFFGNNVVPLETSCSDKLHNKTISTNFVINRSYDFNTSPCNNSCKSKVDVISVQNTDDPTQNTHPKIHIQPCECGAQLLKSKSNSNMWFIENENYYKMLSTKSIDSDAELKSHHQPLQSTDLLQIAKQVSTGMEFLSKNKVVHRDLAARNILVCQDRTVKIADFGLSRDIYQENIYKQKGGGKLPIKWMALESLTHQVYTTKSDVWSYGVLLYEIATLGGTPYPLISPTGLLKFLKTGCRIEKPKNCSQQLYDLMLSCWHENPNQRPTFTEICKILDEFLLHSQPQNFINLNFSNNNKEPQVFSTESYLKPI